eukprot:1162144-Pelagomonas_calceolata.AAC.3
MEDGTTLVYTAPITARTAITRLSPAAGSIGGRTMLTIAGTGGVWGGEDSVVLLATDNDSVVWETHLHSMPHEQYSQWMGGLVSGASCCVLCFVYCVTWQNVNTSSLPRMLLKPVYPAAVIALLHMPCPPPLHIHHHQRQHISVDDDSSPPASHQTGFSEVPDENVVVIGVPTSTTFLNGVILCDVTEASATQLTCVTRPHLAAREFGLLVSLCCTLIMRFNIITPPKTRSWKSQASACHSVVAAVHFCRAGACWHELPCPWPPFLFPPYLLARRAGHLLEYWRHALQPCSAASSLILLGNGSWCVLGANP